MFHTIGTQIFIFPGEALVKIRTYKNVTSFKKHSPSQFSTSTYYKFKFDHCDEQIIAYLNEEKLFKFIYTDKRVYESLGREACCVLDFVYSLGGTEAVVESYYSVMESQRQDGGQHNYTLDMRTLLSLRFQIG